MPQWSLNWWVMLRWAMLVWAVPHGPWFCGPGLTGLGLSGPWVGGPWFCGLYPGGPCLSGPWSCCWLCLSGPCLSGPWSCWLCLVWPCLVGPCLSGLYLSRPCLSGPCLNRPWPCGPCLGGPCLSGPFLSGPWPCGPCLGGPRLSGPCLSRPWPCGPCLSGPFLKRLCFRVDWNFVLYWIIYLAKQVSRGFVSIPSQEYLPGRFIRCMLKHFAVFAASLTPVLSCLPTSESRLNFQWKWWWWKLTFWTVGLSIVVRWFFLIFSISLHFGSKCQHTTAWLEIITLHWFIFDNTYGVSTFEMSYFLRMPVVFAWEWEVLLLCRFHTLLVLSLQVSHPPGPVSAGSTPSWSCLFRFYTLLVLSTLLFGKPPFRNLVANGLVLVSWVIWFCWSFHQDWCWHRESFSFVDHFTKTGAGIVSHLVLLIISPRLVLALWVIWFCWSFHQDWCWHRESFSFMDHFAKTDAGIVSHLVLWIISPRLVLASWVI